MLSSVSTQPSPPSAQERALELLSLAEHPVCIAGRGAVWSGASQALLELCKALPKLRVASTPGAKGVIPERHPQALGVYGFGGHRAAITAVDQADLLLVVGSRLHEPSTCHWRVGAANAVMIRVDVDPRRGTDFNLARPECETLGFTHDAVDWLKAIIAKLPPPSTSPSRRNAVHRVPRHSAVERHAGQSEIDRHVKPQALFGVLSDLAQHVMIAADAGNSMCWAIEWLERNHPGNFQVSVDWGSMGFALPTAIGVSLSRQKATTIAVTGDGSLLMAGGDLHTAVEQELPVITLVLNDGGAGMVKAGCDAWFGPDQVPSPLYRYKLNCVAWARALGAHGELVTNCHEFRTQLRRALARPTPTVFDVRVIPDEVPGALKQRVAGFDAEPSPQNHIACPRSTGNEV